jgi:hypothetical protein
MRSAAAGEVLMVSLTRPPLAKVFRYGVVRVSTTTGTDDVVVPTRDPEGWVRDIEAGAA